MYIVSSIDTFFFEGIVKLKDKSTATMFGSLMHVVQNVKFVQCENKSSWLKWANVHICFPLTVSDIISNSVIVNSEEGFVK